MPSTLKFDKCQQSKGKYQQFFSIHQSLVKESLEIITDRFQLKFTSYVLLTIGVLIVRMILTKCLLSNINHSSISLFAQLKKS